MPVPPAFVPSDVPYLVTAIHRGYAPGKAVIRLTDPNVIESGRIVLQRGVSVEGYVRYADDVPAEGLRITAQPDWWNITTSPPLATIDAEGYFSLPHIAPGTYGIDVHIPRSGGGSTSKRVMQIPLPLESGVLEVKLQSPSPSSLASISGTVHLQGASGAAPRITVSAYSEASGFKQGRVVGDMFYVDSLKPGLHRLTFSGDRIVRKILAKVSAPSDMLDVELRCINPSAKPRLLGNVIDAVSKEPIGSYTARVMKVQWLQGDSSLPSDRWFEFNSDLGAFDIEVTPGVYTVQIAAEGYAWAWSDPIRTDKDASIIVELPRGGQVRGRVLNEDGQPIDGATVTALSRARGSRDYQASVFTSTKGSAQTTGGKFVLENLMPGGETLKVTHPDYSQTIVGGIQVQRGATNHIEIVMPVGGTLQGHVYNVQGEPQAGVRLEIQDDYGHRTHDEYGRLAAVVTDANGFYRVEHLPAQPCSVRRSRYYNASGVVCQTVVPKNNQTVTLDFGGASSIHGQVLLDGRLLADNKMMLADPFDTQTLAFQAYVTTDAQGRFDFQGVSPGLYGLYYQLPQDARYTTKDWAKLTLVHKFENDIDLGTLTVSYVEIKARVSLPSNTEAFDGVTISLQHGSDFFGSKTGHVAAPTQPDQPYRITRVPSGTYTLVARRNDYIQFRTLVQFDTEQSGQSVDLTVPPCSASISGSIRGRHPSEVVMLCNHDQSVVGYVAAQDDGTYRIEHLPAGEYTMGSYYSVRITPFVRFTLAEGEAKSIDVDVSSWTSVNKGRLHTQILDDQDTSLTKAKVWLEADDRTVSPYKVSSEGQFFVTEPGHYTLMVECPGHRTATQAIFLKPCDLMAADSRKATKVIYLGR